jgi:hypothetical protein
MSKVLSQNKHVAKERGNKYGKVRDYKCKKVGMMNKTL